jgi:hypothetical protein
MRPFRIDARCERQSRGWLRHRRDTNDGTVNLLDQCWERARSGLSNLDYAAAVTPVTLAQSWKAWVRAARYSAAGI